MTQVVLDEYDRIEWNAAAPGDIFVFFREDNQAIHSGKLFRQSDREGEVWIRSKSGGEPVQQRTLAQEIQRHSGGGIPAENKYAFHLWYRSRNRNPGVFRPPNMHPRRNRRCAIL